jgi:hypothetical protein
MTVATPEALAAAFSGALNDGDADALGALFTQGRPVSQHRRDAHTGPERHHRRAPVGAPRAQEQHGPGVRPCPNGRRMARGRGYQHPDSCLPTAVPDQS